MPTPKTPRLRGLSAIRTLGGRTDESSSPYKAYLRLATLELEKTRRSYEGQSAIKRADVNDARIAEIEAEQAAVLARLRESRPDDPVPQTPAPPPTQTRVGQSQGMEPNDSGSASPMRFRY